jgi:hypothetical protein
MTRTTFSQAAGIWVAGRVLRPVTGGRWAMLRVQAALFVEQDTLRRCLIGHGALRDHAVYRTLSFEGICGQPVSEVTGGDMPKDITCWTCLIRLGRAVKEKEMEKTQ